MLLLLRCALTAVRQLLRTRGDLVLEKLAEPHQLGPLLRRQALVRALADLGLAHPAVQGRLGDAELGGDPAAA